MSLNDVGDMLTANIGAAYLGLFVVFAALEMMFGAPQPAGAGSRRRALVNFGLPAINFAIGALLPFSVISAAIQAEQAHVGLMQQIAAPAALVLAVAVLSRTFLIYAMHRLSHSVPLLWRLHRCHHSDPHVDLSLALRQHPLAILPGLVVYAPAVLALGLPVWAVAMVELMLILGNYWEHIAIRLPAGVTRWLGLLFVTPDIHRVHHSADQAQTDRNFSSLLTLWDHVFGTFTSPDTSPVARTGLGDADDRLADSLAAQLMLPFARDDRQVVELRR